MKLSAMNRFAAAATFALLGAVTFPAFASEALADKQACLNCHQIAKKSIGPSFQSIAAKYKTQAGAAELMLEKIAKGGTGVWGAAQMPPMAHVPADDAKAIVAWMLKL